MRGRRLPVVEVGVGIAAMLSAVVLMGMLASPLIVTEIAILMPERVNPTLLQAVETSSPGAPGIVLDLVTAVEPSLNPILSQPS